MNNQLVECLNKGGRYSEKELLLLEEVLECRILEKEEMLLHKGEICTSLCFIISGAVYQYETDAVLNKNVIDLHVSNDWVINHKSFTAQIPSEYWIQAFQETAIYTLSIEAIHQLIAQSQSFLQMGRILEESTARLAFFDNNYTPAEKYQFILDHKPELIQSFPQKLIASYLKITPETLSRVRNRFSTQ